MPIGIKDNETRNQFEGLLGKGKRLKHEVAMADLMVHMRDSVKKHSRRGLGNQSSQEYQNVQSALSNVVFTTNGSFTNDVAANEKMMTQAMGYYYKLLAACEAYLAKPGGFSMSGRARKNKVKEVQKYAQRDLVGIEQAFYAMKSMSGQQQSTLSWGEIFHSARMEMLEVDDYASIKSIGAGVKTGDNAGKMLKEGIFAPNTTKTFHGGSSSSSGDGADIVGNTFRASKEFNDKNLYQNITTNVTNRNVATSRVANLIGLGGIVEQSKTVSVKDKKTGEVKTGSLMTRAEGDEMAGDIKKNLREKMDKQNDTNEREKMAKEKIAPSMQKELSSLQVLDYLCGQGDRHRGNYFIEKDKNNEKYTHLHGIDNDTSFSTGIDADYSLKEHNHGFYGEKQHWRIVVDSEDNLVIPHMDEQLAKNIVDLKDDELRFVLKDLLEPVFVEAAVGRLQKLRRGIKNEMCNTNSKVFLNEGQWDENSLEDFLQAGTRRKMENDLPDKFKSKMFYLDNRKDKYELSKQDNYISALVDDMVGFNTEKGFYRTSKN